MFPEKHIFFGAIFSFLIFLIYPKISWYALLIFLSSFLIDFDHYLVYIKRKKSSNIFKASRYFKGIHKTISINLNKGIKVKAPLFFMHTLEFIIIIFILALFFPIFLFILSGILFHFLLDMIDMLIVFGTNPRSLSAIEYFINSRKISNIKYL